jgi:hypothetical protein
MKMLKDMKITKFTVVALIAALFVGCAEGNLSFGGDDNGGDNTVSNTGLLSIANLAVDCRVDESDPDMGILGTRATRSANVDQFDCTIINSDNEVVMTFKYGERPTADVELATGDYIFKIQSGEVQGAAWDAPEYGTERAFKIVRNQTTTLSEIVCSLLQIKVSVSYAPDLLERLGEKTVTEVTVGENTLSFSLTESRAAFFVAPQVLNDIEMCIKGTYAADKENFKPIEMNKQVRDVKAGQHSKIHFYIEHAAEGNINVGVTLQNWVTDEIIPCNVADLVTEEEWKEPSGDNQGGNDDSESTVEDPSIVWDGHDISQREQIVGGLDVDLLISASKGIKEFYVKIESASLTPVELAAVGLCDILNLCYPKQSYDSNNPGVFIDVEEPLRGLGFAVAEEVVNKTFVKLSITQFMGVLQAVSGNDLKNHDFVLTVVDNEGNTTVKTLMLQTGK